MRILISHLVTETNTFSPFPTGCASYKEMTVHRGTATRLDPDGVFGVLTIWRRMAEAGGHEIIESLAAQAQPGGTVLRRTYEEFRDTILRDVRQSLPLDAVLLNLHGAMVADGYDDCEGDLLEDVRRIVGPDVAIGVELDLHCHLTSRMIDASDILVAYKHYPHTDIAQRAAEVFELTVAMAEGRIQPVTRGADCQTIGLWNTTQEPVAAFVQALEDMETRPGVLSVSFGHGFPWGDVAETGASLWVITDGDGELAEILLGELVETFLEIRASAVQPLLTIAQALEAVDRATSFPVVIADGADNAGGGAPSDSTYVLRELIDRAVGRTLVALLYDPEAVRLLAEAGEGATLDVRLGGKTGVTSGDPVDLRVTVRAIRRDHAQTGLGLRWPLGTTVWISAAHDLDIIVSSIRCQPFDPGAIEAMGVSLGEKCCIVLKSMQHFQATFASLARGGILHLVGPGALSRDFANIPYRKRQPDYWPRNAAATPRPILTSRDRTNEELQSVHAGSE